MKCIKSDQLRFTEGSSLSDHALLSPFEICQGGRLPDVLTSQGQFSCPVLRGSALPGPEELCSPPDLPPSLLWQQSLHPPVPHSSRTKISYYLGPPPATCTSTPFSFPHHVFPFLPTLTLPAGPSQLINARGKVFPSLFPLKSNGQLSPLGIFVKI